MFSIISHFTLNNNNIMRKTSNLTAEKAAENKNAKKTAQEIKFNLSPCNLACFKGGERPTKSKCKVELPKQSKSTSQHKIEPKTTEQTKKQEPTVRDRDRTMSRKANFNEQVVIMEYGNLEVYIDNSKSKKSNEAKSKHSSSKKKSEASDEFDADIVSSCVRVITQETDYTSLKTPPSLTPRSNYYQLSEVFDPYARSFTPHNKRSVTIEQGRNFIIDFDLIEEDGRTTVMVKNIPNKYSQQTLLQQFSVHFENKFDFFYLPIDKDNDCNVGYAFVNFVSPIFLKEFYLQFHNKKWKKYKSPKICNISYARYQGTLQLANHFRHSKILQHKDRKLKPLIGIAEASRIKDIEEMVRIQQERE